MSYSPYKTQVRHPSPVAVKCSQSEVNAPDHDTWGMVNCDDCSERFMIGPNRHYGSPRSGSDCAIALETVLKNDHDLKQGHRDMYELPEN
jgi:hypothetical protein